MSLKHFCDAYVETALWSSTDNSRDDGGDPLDKNYDASDIAAETRAKMKADCEKFYDRMVSIIDAAIEKDPDLSDARAGHDFWLTRNGHGAGFWDGDWPEPEATKLDKESKRFGGVDLYIGDNGKIYGSSA
jgi:hypothetical protein